MAEVSMRQNAVIEEESLPEDEVDVEMALLAVLASRDVGMPTEPVRLDSLSDTEKQVLLRLMRERFGFAETAMTVDEAGLAGGADLP
jgi:hypothetical protein